MLSILLCSTASFAQPSAPAPEKNPKLNKAQMPDEFVSVDTEPQPMKSIQSLVVYPLEAKQKKIEGRVIVSALIDTSGEVIKTRIEHSDNSLLDSAAQKAVSATKFTPASYNGIPVMIWYSLPVIFRLSDAGRQPE